MYRLTFCLALVTFALAFSVAGSQEKAKKAKITVGQRAPDFTLKDENGKEVKLSDFRKKKSVLLLFYPKDFTGG